MGGLPCIRGLRIPVGTVVGMVASGLTVEQVLRASAPAPRRRLTFLLNQSPSPRRGELDGAAAPVPIARSRRRRTGNGIGIRIVEESDSRLTAVHPTSSTPWPA